MNDERNAANGGEHGEGANGGEEAGAGGADQAASTPSVGPWHILGLFLIIAGIVLLVLILKSKWNNDTDTVTGVLAVIIPAFATVGAAIFGATVAYSAGKSTGESAGKREGEANKGQAVKEGKQQLANTVLKPLRKANESVNNIVPPLARLPSPAGEEHFLIDASAAADPIRIPIKDVQGVPAGMEEAIHRLEEETS